MIRCEQSWSKGKTTFCVVVDSYNLTRRRRQRRGLWCAVSFKRLRFLPASLLHPSGWYYVQAPMLALCVETNSIAGRREEEPSVFYCDMNWIGTAYIGAAMISADVCGRINTTKSKEVKRVSCLRITKWSREVRVFRISPFASGLTLLKNLLLHVYRPRLIRGRWKWSGRNSPTIANGESYVFGFLVFFLISFIFLLRYDTSIVDYLSVLSTALCLGGVMVIGRSDRWPVIGFRLSIVTRFV